MKHLHTFLLVALLATAVPVCNADPPVRNDISNDARHRYLLQTWDGDSMWNSTLAYRGRSASEPLAEYSKRMLEEMIDEEAAAHVDALSYCLFTAFWSDLPNSKVTDLFPWRPPGVDEAGIDPLKVLMDRCRRHNMKFIADIRMNDRHGVPPNGIMKEHPEWALFNGAWDYQFDGVRQAMLDFTKEVLDTYDVDGIEYDYMRWCHMFKRGEGAANTDILTEFMRKSRKLLDDTAKRRGCERLLFGVRIPQLIGECEYLGYDLPTWIKECLVDYVVPSDFFHTDTNMKTEDFVKLTEGTDCKVYPAIHNAMSQDAPGEHWKVMTAANFRAAAQNFYAFGADGISPYNYQRAWGRRFAAEVRAASYACYMWPGALGYVRELRYPDQIAENDRHYMFYSLHKNFMTVGGYPNDENIYLDRGKGVLEGSRRFRMAEDFTDPRLRATMQFKVLGLTDRGGRSNIRSAGDRLEIRINGAQVPPEYVTIVFDMNPNDLYSGQSVFEGDTLPAFHEYVIDMNWETTGRKQPIVFGDNKLTVRLMPPEQEGEGKVSIEELECYVYVRK